MGILNEVNHTCGTHDFNGSTFFFAAYLLFLAIFQLSKTGFIEIVTNANAYF